jgi:DNA adenine methylase
VIAPPFAYYGGKTRIAARIADLLPDHEHYVEPFAGSLAVLLAKRPSRMETVNDLDRDLMAFWRVLRDRPVEIIRACALTPHSRAEHIAAYEATDDELERARRLWVLLSQGRSARTTKTGWRFTVDPGVGISLPRFLNAYVERMDAVAARLAAVSLECRPALDVIADYGKHPNVCLYVDPPYLAETRSGDGYRHEMPEPEQHRQLLEALRSCRGSIVLSGYDSPLYAEALADWHQSRIGAVSTQGTEASGRVEVLWSNRPLGNQPSLWEAS